LGLAANSDKIAAVVGWIDLASPTIAETLKRYAPFKKLRGFRHIAQNEPDERYLVRDDVVRGIQTLHRFGYVYEILIYPNQLPAAIELVSRLPEQSFVINHLAKPYIKNAILEPWASQMRAIAKHPNVCCKVSGMATEANWQSWTEKDLRPYLDTVSDAFGASRLMFGSDWPVCLLASNYSQVKQVIDNYVKAFTDLERAQIFGKTAASFYGLEGVR
jgi:L-fuconolactonase